MVLQALAMSFFYNAGLTFATLEELGLVVFVFQQWFYAMNDFKRDFELRRVLLGLTSIISQPQLPTIVD